MNIKIIKNLILVLGLLLSGVMFAQENVETKQNIEIKSVDILGPYFVVKQDGNKAYWYDFYNETKVSSKEVYSTIKLNPDSDKMLKMSTFNYVLSIILSTACVSGFVTSMVSQDENVKKISSTVGWACGMGMCIPLGIGLSQERKAVNIYNLSNVKE